VVESLSRSGDLDSLAIIDQSGRKLERLIDRMRFANYGYTAVFDRIQIGDDQLLKIYQYDATIVSELPRFDDAIAAEESAGTDNDKIRAAVTAFDTLVTDFDKRFENREHLFDSAL
ncbi:MAG TPA: hypothetical protein VJN22_03050, partial [Candidatus Eremiobacteraceae bacterium]|nr:hypothetical protein [Candidatus Eremiobacteraceae bacterium]